MEHGFFGTFSDELFISEDEKNAAVAVENSAEDFEPSAEEITTTQSEPVSKSETFQAVSEGGTFRDTIFVGDDQDEDGDDEDEEAPSIGWSAGAGEKNAPQATTTRGEEIMSLTENQPSQGKPQTIPCSFVFTNPITLAMVSGLARNFDGKTLEFTPDIASFIVNLDRGTRIENATLKAKDRIEPVRATVVSNDGEKIILKVAKK